MVWAPNTGNGFPYSVSFAVLNTSPADRAAMDTNGNGILDIGDDPYLPFYPGDAFVDWVGLSSYWYRFDHSKA